MSDNSGTHKKDHGRYTGGFILIGLGLIFLLSNLNLIPGLHRTWPLFLIVIGAALVFGALRKRNEDASMPPPPPPYNPPPTYTPPPPPTS